MRGRAWRRKKTESKWNSRCKRFLFDSIILDGSREHSWSISDGNGGKCKRVKTIPYYRKPLTWKEMKDRDPWAKFLKNGTTYRTYVSDKMEAHKNNKLQRESNKRIINDGIKEYEDLYDETYESWYNEDVNEWQPMYQSGYKVA